MATWASEAELLEGADDIHNNLAAVSARVAAAAALRSEAPPALIAVSKTKPLGVVAAAARDGHRDFGENYIQELVDKAMRLRELGGPEDLRWHFIGRIQSNKVKLLCSAPQLHAVHTVHDVKLAKLLDRHWGEQRPGEPPLKVMVQVNTSGEESKGGCEPSDAAAIALVCQEACNLELLGLMCIGKYSASEGDASSDFRSLTECRENAAAALDTPTAALALSMGMSHDFETAIEHGATHVRVGSTIFGARAYAASKPATP